VDDAIAIEEALAGLEPQERMRAAAPVLVDCVVDALDLDEDELNAAARRGLLLAAAEGNPAESSGSGSRAALETAADLAADGYGPPLAAALVALRDEVPVDCPLVAAAVAELVLDERAALEALAVVVLHRALG
jgi:hypothetical protein